MGTTMHLLKCPKELIAYKDEPFFMDMVCEMLNAYRYGRELGPMKIMCFWMNQNQIFEWFVQNLGVNDDIPYWEVSKEQLSSLLETCEEVLHSGLKSDGTPNAEQCQKIMSLPEQSIYSYWIGGFRYDDSFLCGIKEAIQELRELFAETDFETESIFYWWTW
jgi:hypothetical protein